MAEAVKGGSVMQTTAVALPVGAGLAIAQYLVAPSWPPPDSILAITVAATAPLWHLLGRAIYLRVASWAGEEGASPNGGSAEAAPTPPPPAPNIPAPPVAPVNPAVAGTGTLTPPLASPLGAPP